MWIIGIATLIDRLVCLAMLLGSPLSPLAASILSGQGRFMSRPMQTIRQSWRHTLAMARARVISRAIVSRFHPDQEVITGQCTHCGKCCLDKQCVFLVMSADGKSSCSVHGGWLWTQLRCADYPVSGHDIALYGCPSFVVSPQGTSSSANNPNGRSVIPIRRS
jgi:hypothetical protein